MEIAAARLLRKPFLAKLEKKKNVRTSRVLPGASVLAVLLSSVRKFRILASQAGGHMHLPSREAARLALLIGCVLALVALYPLSFLHAQEKPVEKSAADQQPTAAPTPPEQPAQQRLGTELDGPVIVNTDLITLTVTVTDTYGRYVSGLGKNAFQLLDQKLPQEITFFSDDDSPVSVGVLFDVSGSMSGEKIKNAREALSKFIQTSHNNDEYFLIGFNSRAQLLLDKTRDGNAVLDKLSFVQTKTTQHYMMPATWASKRCSAAFIPSVRCY